MDLLGIYYDLEAFISRGGVALSAIILATGLMWVLIAARLRFFLFEERGLAARLEAEWRTLAGHSGWAAAQIRRQLISLHTMELRKSQRLISTLVQALPLLGLMGTVLGMIEVFEVMAARGSSNYRHMASGIGKATITTMAGMVAALSGVFIASWLSNRATLARAALVKRLETRR